MATDIKTKRKNPFVLLCSTAVRKSNNKVDTKVDFSRSPKLCVGDFVFAHIYASGAKWLLAVITKNIGSMMYLVGTDRTIWRRHQNQLEPRLCDFSSDDRNTNNKRNTPESISEQTSERTSNDNANYDNEVPTCGTQRRYLVQNRRTSDFFQVGFG